MDPGPLLQQHGVWLASRVDKRRAATPQLWDQEYWAEALQPPSLAQLDAVVKTHKAGARLWLDCITTRLTLHLREETRERFHRHPHGLRSSRASDFCGHTRLVLRPEVTAHLGSLFRPKHGDASYLWRVHGAAGDHTLEGQRTSGGIGAAGPGNAWGTTIFEPCERKSHFALRLLLAGVPLTRDGVSWRQTVAQLTVEEKTFHPKEGFLHGPHRDDGHCRRALGHESERRGCDCAQRLAAPGNEGFWVHLRVLNLLSSTHGVRQRLPTD